MLPVSVPEDFDEGQLQEQSSSDADVSVAESTISLVHPAEVMASELGKHSCTRYTRFTFGRAVLQWPILPSSLPVAAIQLSCFLC